ncbi:MAG: hypothetical protein JO067_01605 [Cupriavidus sp.]|nr:hypothetical protein [Cupriavidus sp.]
MIIKKKLGRTQGMCTPLQAASRVSIARLLQEFAKRYFRPWLPADVPHLTPAELSGLYLLLVKQEVRHG